MRVPAEHTDGRLLLAQAGLWDEARSDLDAAFAQRPPAVPHLWTLRAMLLVRDNDREG